MPHSNVPTRPVVGSLHALLRKSEPSPHPLFAHTSSGSVYKLIGLATDPQASARHTALHVWPLLMIHTSRTPHTASPFSCQTEQVHQTLPLRGSSQGRHAFQRWRSSQRQDSKSSRTSSLLVRVGIADSISPPRIALSFNHCLSPCASRHTHAISMLMNVCPRPNALPNLQHQETRLELRATPGLQQHLAGVLTKLFDRYVGTAGHVLVLVQLLVHLTTT